jgi:putative restriction endonuclease
MSKLHHAAFDAHLIGIDPDLKVHVSTRLLEQHDGPTLESLKSLHGKLIRVPKRVSDKPDPHRLEARFSRYKAAN